MTVAQAQADGKSGVSNDTKQNNTEIKILKTTEGISKSVDSTIADIESIQKSTKKTSESVDPATTTIETGLLMPNALQKFLRHKVYQQFLEGFHRRFKTAKSMKT
ncbi:hypothetical protein LOAG_05604 [Loa loa]|uniref:Uncharacterized protein n=1 Tax=Loa loa TaxID=7209 RepID=A0A1S0TZP3_LOALO|nr:hypothetical protein LOAG_05604 [Loa loa]EFO22881.1 hypothetical protein LOAG_05604 [Loa loa]